MQLEYENQIKDYESIVQGNERQLEEHEKEMKNVKKLISTLEAQLTDQAFDYKVCQKERNQLKQRCY